MTNLTSQLTSLQSSKSLSKGQVANNIKCEPLIAFAQVKNFTPLNRFGLNKLNKSVYTALDELLLLNQRSHRKSIGE